MYRIYDKPAAIMRVQNYLRAIGNQEIFVAPTGVFDDNTRLSVIDFQSNMLLAPTGIVDRITFDLLFEAYEKNNDKAEVNKDVGSFIIFPILPGYRSRGMIHINRTLGELLNYYGFTHNIRSNSNLYTSDTSDAVKTIRTIYNLSPQDLIDEEFYKKIMLDRDSIEKIKNMNNIIA